VPGYLTLASKSGDSIVPTAYGTYRQNVLWQPDSLPGWRGDLRVAPSVRVQMLSRETGIDLGLGIEHTADPWFVRAEPKFTQLDHKQSTGGYGAIGADFAVIDWSMLLTEKYLFPFDIRAYTEETGGWAQKTGSAPGRGWYASVRPGFNWQPAAKGWADASYTFSYVNIPGEIDYRMAGGYTAGLSHVINVFADIKMGQHFSISANYRGELVKRLGQGNYDKMTNTMTMEVKAML
jgi:hypothetical protein